MDTGKIGQTLTAFRKWRHRTDMVPEAERAAGRVQCGLWACANNSPVPPALLRGLAEDVAALERALRQQVR
jgi:hypothetical protein